MLWLLTDTPVQVNQIFLRLRDAHVTYGGLSSDGAPRAVPALPVCVHLASAERATARDTQGGSAARQIRHQPRPERAPPDHEPVRLLALAPPHRCRRHLQRGLRRPPPAPTRSPKSPKTPLKACKIDANADPLRA